MTMNATLTGSIAAGKELNRRETVREEPKNTRLCSGLVLPASTPLIALPTKNKLKLASGTSPQPMQSESGACGNIKLNDINQLYVKFEISLSSTEFIYIAIGYMEDYLIVVELFLYPIF
ncbi:hypothetical protein I4U23_001764 [Adineta vaga]|nr:hypothetical protein I4U23_001764 [Adineta vaga]